MEPYNHYTNDHRQHTLYPHRLFLSLINMKKNLRIPLYIGHLTIIQEDSPDELSKKYNIEDLKDFDAVSLPFHDKNGYTRYVMIFNFGVTPSIIAHEAVHIVNQIFADRDIKLDIDNDEPQAYLMGWIVKQCHKYLEVHVPKT